MKGKSLEPAKIFQSGANNQVTNTQLPKLPIAKLPIENRIYPLVMLRREDHWSLQRYFNQSRSRHAGGWVSMVGPTIGRGVEGRGEKERYSIEI